MNQHRKSCFARLCRDYPELADKNSSMYLGTSAFRKDTLISHRKGVGSLRFSQFSMMK